MWYNHCMKLSDAKPGVSVGYLTILTEPYQKFYSDSIRKFVDVICDPELGGCGKTVPALVDRLGKAKISSCGCRNKGGKWLTEYNSKNNRKGIDNPSWKGGRILRADGYVEVYAPEHPRVSTRRHVRRYVVEHILVMENAIGRYLLPGETVHHKNTIRDDNRIENLELWGHRQPTGGRVEDLIEHAKQTLTDYLTPKDIMEWANKVCDRDEMRQVA